MSHLPFPVELPGASRTVLENLWRDGFARISGVWSKAEVIELTALCASLMDSQPVKNWSERPLYGDTFRLPIFEDSTWAVLSNLSGLSRDFDAFFEGLLTHQEIRPILDVILGSDYKIWETSIRRSQVSDGGLALHQDSVGEFGLSILLSDISDMSGTTVFLKGSHRFPVLSKQSGLDQFNPRLLRRFLTPASGKAGDAFLFFKNVWHGRIACNIPQPKDAILMSFVAAGFDYKSFDVPGQLLSALPIETSEMLNPYEGTRILDSGRRAIVLKGTQPERLIDHVYDTSPFRPHLSQFFRLVAPLGMAKKLARRIANAAR